MSPLQRSLYCRGGLYQRTSGPSFSELKFRDKQNCSPTAAMISGFIDRRHACRQLARAGACWRLLALYCCTNLQSFWLLQILPTLPRETARDYNSNRNCSPLNLVFSTTRKEPLTVQDKIDREISSFVPGMIQSLFSFFLSVYFFLVYVKLLNPAFYSNHKQMIFLPDKKAVLNYRPRQTGRSDYAQNSQGTITTRGDTHLKRTAVLVGW